MGHALIRLRIMLMLVTLSFVFPAQVDSLRKPAGPVKLYFRSWIPETRTLDGGLKKSELQGRNHAEALVSPDGMIKRVNLVNDQGIKYLSYDLMWNRDRTWSKYRVTAQVDTSITILNDLFLAHDLSDLRPGYRIEVSDRKNGDIINLRVYDELGGFLYYYSIDYDQIEGGGEKITSRYFKHDSVIVGYHILEFDRGGRLRAIDYFGPDDGLKYSLGYQYNLKTREVSRSIIDENGALLEKRYLPIGEKYLRKPHRRKSGIALSDAVKFLENASEKDIDALTMILEQRYRKEINRVDTTYSPIVNVIDTVVVEKFADRGVAETVPGNKIRLRPFRFSLEIGGAVKSDAYFNRRQILNTAINVNTVRGFRIWFLPRFKPVIAASFLNFDSKIYPAFKGGLIIPGHFPLNIPFELSGEVGYSKAGPEFTGSIMLLRSKNIVIGLKTEASIYPSIFNSGELTALVNGKIYIGI